MLFIAIKKMLFVKNKWIFLLTFLSTISFAQNFKKATFSGGCFWCMEPPFEKLDGVKSVISGYAGGVLKNPTYEKVSSGTTKHIESIQVTFDPKKVSYKKLLEVFWTNINPTDAQGQFVDRGHQYTTAIFYHDIDQEKLAKSSKQQLAQMDVFGKPIVTPIRKFTTFYPAEDYHQDYYKRSVLTKVKYKYYRSRSGRDDFLEKFWKNRKFKIK